MEETEARRRQRLRKEIIGGWQQKCREIERQRRGQEKQQQPSDTPAKGARENERSRYGKTRV
jgi:hypothetical protein